jgi:peptidoglycan/xylan/chitin deacetylase (PgdA/CDA1 family)
LLVLVALAGLLPGCRAPLAEPHAPPPPPRPTSEEARPIEVAVTFDDLPRHGKDLPGLSRAAIHRKLLDTLRAHHLPPVYGFVNAVHLEEHPDDREALTAWIDAGQPLGNHTYSHINPNKSSLAAYLADIDRNEAALTELSGPGREGAWKVFRYPYLREGTDAALRDSIRRHLATRGYRVAHVTIDFYDWGWTDPYVRCLTAGDEASLAWLRSSFLEAAEAALRWSADAAKQLVGRPIKHVLMLHASAFEAVMLDELLRLYEAADVRFVSLDEALSDPVYQVDTRVTQPRGDALLEQLTSRSPAHPPHPARPLAELEQRCR